MSLVSTEDMVLNYLYSWTRDAPNMLKNLPIIPSGTSQNLSLLFFKIPPIIPKLFRSDSKEIIAIARLHSYRIKDLAQKVPYNIEKVHKLIAELQTKYFQYAQ